MPRQTRQQLDDEIIESAATLFARHGFKQTSVQAIADAVGYSKAGLLHRYPSKEALQDAVIDRCLGQVREIAAGVTDLEPGPARDRAVVTAVVDLAMRRPGFVALLLSLFVALDPGDGLAPRMQEIGDAVFGAFGVVPTVGLHGAAPGADADRTVRVLGALGALSVARLAVRGGPPPDLPARLVALACDTLGHPRPGTS